MEGFILTALSGIIISFKNISIILLSSTLIGLAANYFNPNGISLFRSSKEIPWVSDSLFNISRKDTISSTPADVLGSDSVLTEKIIEKKDTEKIVSNISQEKIIKEEEKLKSAEVNNDEQDFPVFEEPKNITLEQAYALFNDGVTFIDARDEAEYLTGYITGSINIPYYDFDNHKQKLNEVPKAEPLVIYCAGTDCDLSILLANQLSKLGYKQIYIFFGGWLEWQNADYPTNNSSNE